MTARPRPESPRILPIHRPVGLLGLLDDVVAEAARRQRERGHDPVDVTIDVADGLETAADPRVLRGILAPLVEAALAASAARDRRRPGCGEVVVTAVACADRVEIEVADSGDAVEPGVAAEVHALANRAGVVLAAARCPEGGTAITLHVPRRAAGIRAA